MVAGPLYLWDTNITPDQLWASRRFVPFVLPLFVIAAVWALDLGLAHLPTRRARRVGLGIAVAFGLVTVLLLRRGLRTGLVVSTALAPDEKYKSI